MNASEIETAFGKTEDSPEVSGLLSRLGVTSRPKLVDGVAEIKFPDLGLRLAFRPETSKSSKLMLSSIIFHSGSEKEYQPFAGSLPRGLTFADGRDAVRRKLGTPTIASTVTGSTIGSAADVDSRSSTRSLTTPLRR